MLSIPPQATKLPDGAKATDITQAERNGITCTLLPVHESQIINFPSSEPVTQCLPVPNRDIVIIDFLFESSLTLIDNKKKTKKLLLTAANEKTKFS